MKFDDKKQPETPEISRNDWRDKYADPNLKPPYRLENSADDSELNRMIRLKTFDRMGQITGEPGKLYYDKTNEQIKVYMDSYGWVNLLTSSTLVVPHMMQSDTTDQAIANINNAQVITFDTDNHHQNITRTSSSRFTITVEGSYLICFSGIAKGTTNKQLQVWLKKNTAYVDNSNTIYTFKGTATLAVIAVSFIEHFEVGDYFEFWTWGDDVSSTWEATAAGSSPTRPACPSIIITANLVSQD